MKTTYLTICILIFTTIFAQAQYWTPSSNNARATVDSKYVVEAEESSYFNLDFDGIRQELTASRNQRKSQTIINLPMSDGSMQAFRIEESSVMQSRLQAKYPHIRSYKGYAVDRPSINVRISTNRAQLHAAIHSPEKVTYIDPQGGNLYVSYNVHSASYNLDPNIPMCGTKHANHVSLDLSNRAAIRTTKNASVPIHEYVIAIACTGEFGQWKGTSEKILADMVTGINRMNQIFENELSMRVVLVNDNDKLFFFDPATDPYENTKSGKAMLRINTSVISGRIPNNSYDVGHVYHVSCDVGGIAALGSMCTNIKGNGVTCHYRNDIDYMASRVTAHELGHQMSADHTFNNCNGNEVQGNGFEPGSGSTIMSYGGLCGHALNVVSVSDDYYHGASLEQIYNHLRNGGTADKCAEKIPTDNVAPEIFLDYKNGFYIPTSTYFYLEGRATDANNDELTYAWEQRNAGPRSPLGKPIGNAPNFACYKPSSKPYRFFNSPRYILANVGTNTEVLPKEEKNMIFNLVVRDNHPTGGIATWKQMKFWVTPSDNGEKFGITNFRSSATMSPGEETKLTWNVAHTADEKINCQSMDLYAYGGDAANFHFDNFHLIKKNIPNTGSVEFRIPNLISDKVKFILKASNSIFFDVTAGNVNIQQESPALALQYNNPTTLGCLPSSTKIDIKTIGYGGITGDVQLSITSKLPKGVTASLAKDKVPVGGSTSLNIQADDSAGTQDYNLEIQALIPQVDTATTTYPVRFINTDHSSLAYEHPVNNATGIATNTDFSWTPSANATSYDILVATSPSFESNTIVLQEQGLKTAKYQSQSPLDKNNVYYWKVVSKNECGEDSNPKIGAFATEALSCTNLTAVDLPQSISSVGKPQVDVKIPMNSGGEIADVNVSKLVIDHANNKDMTITLLNPSGESAILVHRKCNQRNVNCSFDDASSVPVKCPLSNKSVYKPIQPLSVFNGKDGKGNWVLRVKDHKSGDGGRIKEVVLEVCSNASLNSPTLVTNEELRLPPKYADPISRDLLRANDNDNSDAEIVYTIVTLPTQGAISVSGKAASVGTTFTQQDINNNVVRYRAGAKEGKDAFTFTINDGSGGFVGVTTFGIDINESHPSATSEEKLEDIHVFPNPVAESLHIDLGNNFDIKTIAIYDMIGTLRKKVLPTETSVSVENLASGVYLMVFSNGKQKVTRRISVLR